MDQRLRSGRFSRLRRSDSCDGHLCWRLSHVSACRRRIIRHFRMIGEHLSRPPAMRALRCATQDPAPLADESGLIETLHRTKTRRSVIVCVRTLGLPPIICTHDWRIDDGGSLSHPATNGPGVVVKPVVSNRKNCSNREQASVDKLSGVPYRSDDHDETHYTSLSFLSGHVPHRSCHVSLWGVARDGCELCARPCRLVSESATSPW